MLQIRDKLPVPDKCSHRSGYLLAAGLALLPPRRHRHDRDRDPVIGEREFVLPPQTTMINSAIWLSIGYMLGACTGAAIAQAEQIADGTCPTSDVRFSSRWQLSDECTVGQRYDSAIGLGRVLKWLRLLWMLKMRRRHTRIQCLWYRNGIGGGGKGSRYCIDLFSRSEAQRYIQCTSHIEK